MYWLRRGWAELRNEVFVLPSRQENLPYTVMEAMACGVPCVAFDVGGVHDLVEHERTGWLARPGDAADLARGIAWVLEDDARRRALANRSRRKTEEEFELTRVARLHGDLYREVLAREGV